MYKLLSFQIITIFFIGFYISQFDGIIVNVSSIKLILHEI